MNNYEYTNKWVGRYGYVVIFDISDAEMRSLDVLDFPQWTKDIHVRVQNYQKEIGIITDESIIVKFAAEKQIQLFIYHKKVFEQFEKEFNDMGLQIYQMRE